MTMQVARIDAHLLNRKYVTRLCYAGSVLHTKPSGLHATREPMQIGAEIYGHAGLEADAEIQQMAVASLRLAGLTEIRLDLCHVGVLRALVNADPSAKGVEKELYRSLRSKDIPALKTLTANCRPEIRDALLALPTLYGNHSIVERARRILPCLPGIVAALSDLEFLMKFAKNVAVTIDLADLHGYQYESGVMFALYVPNLPNAVARGGRYDHVGESFGRGRPASGFSMDLRELARLAPAVSRRSAILAPWNDDPRMQALLDELRAAGEIVIQRFPSVAGDVTNADEPQDSMELECDRSLVFENGNWIIKNLG
jgi:ATP phosphoribosyltransferase regulatory subunit